MKNKCLIGVILLCFSVIGFLPSGNGQTDHVSELISQLKDPDPIVRIQALTLLAESEDPRAIEPMIAMLKVKDPDYRIRMMVLGSLSGFHDPRVVESLTTALKDPNPYVQRTAARVLYAIKKSQIKPVVYANDILANVTLHEMASACESYSTANNGAFPSNEAALTGATPPYLNTAYCATSQANPEGFAGYKYDCSRMSESGYTIVATPVTVGSTGSATETIRTGGVLSP